MNLYGLVGKSLKHSFSQKYFLEFFHREKITDHNYALFETHDLDGFVADLKNITELKGLNVTIPYKTKIISHLDELSPEAREIGGVNCISIRKEKGWKGHNTDWIGFDRSLAEEDWKKLGYAYILGSGGASLAIAYALKNRGIPYKVVSRTPVDEQIDYNQIEYQSKVTTLIIHCTPLGTFPDIHSAPPLDFAQLKDNFWLYDLTYNPEYTQFMKLGALRNCRVFNGLRMLEIQAQESWRIWNES